MAEVDPFVADLDALIAELDRADANAEELVGLKRQVARIVEVLVARGVLSPRDQKVLDALARAQARPRVRLNTVGDKRSIPSPDIDCASLLHLCHGRCCTMRVMLSKEDLDDRKFRWVLDDPYYLERGNDGYCTHLRADDGGCEHYADRPAQCRKFDCRTDPRIWIDFEQKIPAPLDPALMIIPRY